MNANNRELLLARIKSGYLRYVLDDVVLKIYSPNEDIIYEAKELYNDVYDLCQTEDILTLEDSVIKLVNLDIWTEQLQFKLDVTIPQNLEKLKIEIFNRFGQVDIIKKAKQYLRLTENELSKLYNLRNLLYPYTCEGLATESEFEFIVENGVYTNRGLYNWSEIGIESVMAYIRKNGINNTKLRDIAKNEPWQSYWSTQKIQGKIFKNELLTPEQQQLIMWAKLYDNIRESPDCPEDDIIEDDDALDGWLILQRKKREAEARKGRIENKNASKIKDSDEVFIVADNETEALEILELNSPYSNIIRKQRQSKLAKNKELKFTDFDDIRQRISMECTQMRTAKLKGK